MKKNNASKRIVLILTTLIIATVIAAFFTACSDKDTGNTPPLGLTSDSVIETPPTLTTPEETTTADNTTAEKTTPELTTPQATTPEVTTPPVTTPPVTTPPVTTPEVTTAPITTPPVTEPPAVTTARPEITLPENPPVYEKKLVALTFDDGPNTVRTKEVLAVLEKYNVKATFFVLGQNLNSTAAQNALKLTAEKGHEIANHSYTHPNCHNMTAAEFIADVEKTSNNIYELCGVRPTLVRTPYGNWTKALLNTMDYPIIHWTVDTRDWDHNNPETALSYVKKQVYDGAIILMHDRMSTSAEMTEIIIQWLHENNYEIVTVSELLRLKGTPLAPGYVYFSARNLTR